MQTLGLGFTWEQLSPGQRFRTLNRTVTETDLVMFTGVTGMLESIFIDRTFSAQKGAIQGQFVPAALTYSLIEGLLCQSMIQGTGLAMLELKQQVLAPVRVGDTVHCEIEITAVRPTSQGKSQLPIPCRRPHRTASGLWGTAGRGPTPQRRPPIRRRRPPTPGSGPLPIPPRNPIATEPLRPAQREPRGSRRRLPTAS